MCANFASISLQLEVKEFEFVAQRSGYLGDKKLESVEGMFCWLLFLFYFFIGKC